MITTNFTVMSEKKNDVKFITSLALAINDKDDQVRHIQIVIVQDVESGEFKMMFDIVDPTKIKLADEMSKSDNA